MCSTSVLGNGRPAGSAPCTIHPVLEGLYKNVYNSNVICTIKYFAGGAKGTPPPGGFDQKGMGRGYGVLEEVDEVPARGIPGNAPAG
ncbi:MAG: hypothetical protein CVV34_07195, partial [Methanomicrobiales archaeon HGW-Methanomicrobiales-5]